MVHDRTQVFVTCPLDDDAERPLYVGTLERWTNRPLRLPSAGCAITTRLLILVENMGRVNYGQYLFDKKGILSFVYIDGQPVHTWKILSIPLHKLEEVQNITPIFRDPFSNFIRLSARKKTKKVHSKEPCFVAGRLVADKVKDTSYHLGAGVKGLHLSMDLILDDFGRLLDRSATFMSLLQLSAIERMLCKSMFHIGHTRVGVSKS